jgi:hypothetical protein
LRNREQLNPYAIKKAGKMPDEIEENLRKAMFRQQKLLKIWTPFIFPQK